MQNQELFNYIKENLEKGHNKEGIRKALLDVGWGGDDIDEAFSSASTPSAQPPKPTQATELKPIEENKSRAEDFSLAKKTAPKKLPLALAIVLGLVIVGGAVFGYFNYYKSPGNIISKVINASKEVKSLTYSGQIDITMQAQDAELAGEIIESPDFDEIKDSPFGQFLLTGAMNISIDFNGSVDSNDPENIKQKLKISFIHSLTEEKTGLEIISANDISYFKLDGNFNIGFFDLSSIIGQWFRIDPKEIKEQFSSLLGDQSFLLEQAEQTQELSPEQQMLLEDIISKIPGILNFTQKLPDEEMDGVDTYHQKFSIDKDGVVELVMSINTYFAKEELSQEELDELNTTLDNLDSLIGEVWIGKKDYLIRKISVAFILEPSEEDELNGSVNFSIKFSNHNEPVQINAPESSKTLQEFMEGLFSGLFSGLSGEFESSFSLPLIQ